MSRYLIKSKFAEYVLCPHNAIERDYYRDQFNDDAVLVTIDGVEARAEFQESCDNEDGRYNQALDDLCQKHYGLSFDQIKSIWLSRIFELDTRWHLLKLFKN